MASPNANYDDLATTTIELRSKSVQEVFSNNTAVLNKLSKRGNVQPASGGSKLIEELGFNGPGNAQMYSGSEQLNTAQGDMMTSAEFNWKQAAVAVSMSGLEAEVQNTGTAAFIDLFTSRLDLAEIEMQNLLSDSTNGIYSDGTGSGGKGIGGLQLLISDAGTGTVGNIVSGSYSWWQNQVYDFSSNSVTPSAATIGPAMNQLYLNCSLNREAPDLIVADNTYFTYFEESLQPQQRFMDADMANAGFQNYKYKGAVVVPDGALNGAAPSSHMYFINTKHLKWRPHQNRNMVPLNPQRYAVNQDAFVKLLGFAGNLTTRNRRLQGVIVA